MQKPNLIKRFLFIAPAILLCWCLFSVQGCKDPVIESTNLLRKSDSLNLKKDTLAISVVTQNQVPLVTNGVSQGVLGSIYDRNFGTMYCSFYAQLPLTTASVVIPDSAVLDSVVLTLAYNGQYGVCHKPIDLAVYELDDSMSIYQNYYSNTNFKVKTPALGVIHNFVPDMLDSVYLSSGTYQLPHLRITLSNSFGYRILKDSLGLNNDSAFISHFKGIYVTSTSASTGDGIMYINLTSSISGINFYYHYNYLGVSQPTDFPLNFAGVTVNHYDCNKQGTPLASAIQSPSTAQKVFLEAGSASEGKITFVLDSLLKTGRIAINKAELVMSQSTADTQYAAPIILNLLRIDDAGVGQNLEDASYSSYGGVLTLETASPGLYINRYRFNITRYFQKLVQGIYTNNGLFLRVVNGYDVADRVVISNPSNDKNYKISLSVTYTKL